MNVFLLAITIFASGVFCGCLDTFWQVKNHKVYWTIGVFGGLLGMAFYLEI